MGLIAKRAVGAMERRPELLPRSGQFVRAFAAPLVCGHLLNEHGILTAPAFNNRMAIRIEPALTISHREIDRLLAALDNTGGLIDREDHATLLVTSSPMTAPAG